MNFDYYEDYLTSMFILKKIIMSVLRKINYYSADTCRLMKNQ